MQIILASASPRRLGLLRQVGIEPLVLPADIDENIPETDPAEKVKKLSLLKAKAVDRNMDTVVLLSGKESGAARALSKEAIIIAADTVVTIDGSILGKPGSHEEAYEMISKLAGRSHEVYTGVTLLKSFGTASAWGTDTQSAKEERGHAAGPEATLSTDSQAVASAAAAADAAPAVSTFAVRTIVHVGPMTEEEIRAYADSAEPMDKAGAYGIQGTFARYISGIEGDYYNVVGLPLYETLRQLKEMCYNP